MKHRMNPWIKPGRRGLLLGGALGLLSLTRAGRILGDPPPPPPSRLVLVMQNNGTQQANFWPTAPAQAFTSPILEPLLSDPALARKTRLIRGISVPRDFAGTDGNEHDVGFARLFTGARLLRVGGHPWGGGPSVDQLVARAFGQESLALAVLASGVEPHPKEGFQHRRSFSYVAPGVLRQPTVEPLLAYRRLFADPGELDARTRARLLARKSALDAATGDLESLRVGLPRAERDKLGRHLESVRQIERDVGRSLRSEKSPGALCGKKPALPRDYSGQAPELLVNDESAIPELVGTMIDIAAAALACGATRVATLQLGYAGGKWRFDWEGIGKDFHAELAHRDLGDAGSSLENTAAIVKANRWYAAQIARLARALDAVPEGDGTLLDHTLIVWGNDLGRGDHSLENIPVALIGGSMSGVLGPGGRLIDAGRQPFQRLGCTILRAMGQKADGFGDLPDCGPLRGL